ncbi:MAG: hypothetical protein AMDU3_IPLC00004G0013 [Thermoplasmatales archaeon I-plasma]|jgi:hypothetical protein|nr:MAG: hypothetical protein AMDU3_IPLC00004G0013 [Thermoplasmatales archaeon I-plasma]
MDKNLRLPILFSIFIAGSQLVFYAYATVSSIVPISVKIIANVVAVLDLIFLLYIVGFVYKYNVAHPVKA